jgi:hypothetical protein
MSDTQQGAGWWQASDGKWYAPEQHPDYRAEATPPESGEAQPAAAQASAPAYAAPAAGYEAPGYAAPPPVAILAVIFAIIALRQIAASQGRVKGRGLSIAGLIIGILGILGAAITWIVVGLVAANAHHVTVSEGQTVNVSDSFSLGISTMKISNIQPLDQASGPNSGNYVVANVRVCAGNSGSSTGVIDGLFFLNTQGGNSISGSTTTRVSPDISGSVPSNSCRSGHVTFKVSSGTTPTSIDYHGFLPSTYTWRVSG